MQKANMTLIQIPLNQAEDYELGKLWGSFSTSDFEAGCVLHIEIKQMARPKGEPQLFGIKIYCLRGQSWLTQTTIMVPAHFLLKVSAMVCICSTWHQGDCNKSGLISSILELWNQAQKEANLCCYQRREALKPTHLCKALFYMQQSSFRLSTL